MKRVAQTIGAIVLSISFAVPSVANAQDGRASERRAAPAAQPAIDPLVQALLIGLAASVLREAAASPDPLATFADSLERKLSFALRSPELARLLDQLIADAVKDLPADLREPLAQFAGAMLNTLRSDLLARRQAQRAN